MTKITLMDGSIGQERVKRSGNRSTPLWSAQVMVDQPELVGAVHSDYFAVGASVATANTYAVHRSRLERIGLENEVPALIETVASVQEATGALRGTLGCGKPVWLALTVLDNDGFPISRRISCKTPRQWTRWNNAAIWTRMPMPPTPWPGSTKARPLSAAVAKSARPISPNWHAASATRGMKLYKTHALIRPCGRLRGNRGAV
ncbi:MAG: S-methylmethionine-dependent homocysteine/selenocysteine methylase [Paracoccaceae bacterium]|jgi:S-methylmethionine-dependent homocysteine/selenocysteine methylase